MAEAVVSFVVQRLHDLLIREACFFYGVRDDVNWLHTEFKRMQCFLKDADRKQDTDDRVRNWVSEIRRAAYDTEDIVDTYIFEMAYERRGFTASVKKYACIFKEGASLYLIGIKMEELKKRILDISRGAESYGMRTIEHTGDQGKTDFNGRLRHIRRSSAYADKEEVVGFEDNMKILLNQLLKEERERSVLSIFGMGGLGKTTLARKLYNSSDVKGRFDCYAWVCVSQDYTTRDLLQKTIKSFKKPTKDEFELIEMMSEEDLENHLYEFLVTRRYFIVIDDVWHKEAWESLRRAFPDRKNGSAVIITTRNKAVAALVDEKSFVFNLRFLKPEESWQLFCKKAFLDAADGNTNPCPPGLEELGRQMVGKCGGLPLAIVVLGGLLSRKKPHEWRAVKDHIWRHLTKDSIHVSLILALSYNELPYQLKSCFLYLSLFPEDFVINTEKLIRSWIAEGFIPQGGEAMEDMAEEYLKELIDRSMIQVAERYMERIKACRVHDLLRDLAVQKSKEANLLDIYVGDKLSPSSPPLCRRQAIHSGITRYVSFDNLNPHLRSLLFFNPDHESIKREHLKCICSKFRFLRMLDLEDVRIEPSRLRGKVVRLPDALGKLIHLRYLGFKSNDDIVELPLSILNLQSLQTIVATGKCHLKMPKDISRLVQLRHLIARYHGRLQLRTLTNLQTLKSVKFDQWVNIGAVNLINLRELEIREIPVAGMNTFSLDSLKCLQSLTMHTDIGFNSLLPLSHCQCLIKLKLEGKIENLPTEIREFPPNLTILILYNSKLKQDPMPIFEKLPNLTMLDLGNDSYCGIEMAFSSNGFPQLQVLRLSWLRSFEWLHLEEGAMPRLKSFGIEDCNNLHNVPDKLRILPLPQDW